ncbi:ester cyclase [Mesorhizobium sp. Cs1299R1N3]|uniref:ester cyclase n=1 Tax=Mesorhizobium sp. Cs1299R1N3 TaxID=3015173 RepID=UPI00301D0570
MNNANANIVLAFWEAVNAKQYDGLDGFFTKDYVRHTLHGVISAADFVKILRDRGDAFPDLVSTILDTIENGEKVAYRWGSVGTHRAAYLGIPATNRNVRAQGITISRIKEGRIAEDWSSWETLNVLHSLNVFPL